MLGIRSIGTSLSAIVQARLRAANLNVKRITTRPSGHPFQRTVQLELTRHQFEHAIVVDEEKPAHRLAVFHLLPEPGGGWLGRRRGRDLRRSRAQRTERQHEKREQPKAGKHIPHYDHLAIPQRE